MQRLRTVTSLDVSAVAGHHAMPAALLFPFQNNLQDLDPSYKSDLDFGIVLKEIIPVYN